MIRKASVKLSQNLSFPDNILHPAFENKRLYITIYQPTTIDNIEKKALQIKDELVNAAKNAPSIDITSYKKFAGSKSVQSLSRVIGDAMHFNGKELLTISLPLPNNMKDSQNHEFSLDTGVVKTIVDKFSGVTSSIQKAVSLAANASHQSTIIPNPGYFQNYTGSTPRSFTFDFKLIPNNKKEAQDIVDIVNTIKKYSSPKMSANAFLIAPCFFLIHFSSEYLQDLVQTRPCIINSLETNYSGNGYFDTVADGSPKYVTLSLSVTEIRALTREDWS